MRERALVIGGTGPTGVHIVQGLVARGYAVAILHRGLHETEATPPEVEHLHADPFDEGALTRASRGGPSSWSSRCTAGCAGSRR